MIGGGIFIAIASVMVSGSIMVFAKRREIMAFKLQQIAPVVKEGWGVELHTLQENFVASS